MEAEPIKSVSTPLITRADRWISDGMIELPVLDDVALRVYREARAGNLDAEGICELLQRDPVLVGEVLRLANSGFFGGLVEIGNLRHAAVRLGTRRLAALALSAGCKRLYSASDTAFRHRLLSLWRHTSAVAAGTGWLATHLGHHALADDAFVAGLLHDVGKLLLLRVLEEMTERDGVRVSGHQIDEVLEALHRERGAWLLECWNVPKRFQDLLRRQEEGITGSVDTLLCLVRYVDRACAQAGISDRPDPSIDLASLPESAILGLAEGTHRKLIEVLRLDAETSSPP